MLSDTEKRTQYDQYGQYFGGGVPGAGAGAGGAGGRFGGGRRLPDTSTSSDLGDLGRPVRQRVRRRRRRRRRGARGSRSRSAAATSSTTSTLTFDEALDGHVDARSRSSATETCATCKGTGAKPGTSADDVPRVRRHRARVAGPGHVRLLAAVPALRRHGHDHRAAVHHVPRAGQGARDASRSP